MSKAFLLFVLLFLAFLFNNCSSGCDDCSDDFSVRFTIVDSLNTEVVTDPAQVSITSLESEIYDIEREENEQDTVFLTSFAAIPQPDTVIFFINNIVLDTAAVEYGFLTDSDCCTNPRIVERLNFLNLPTARVIRAQYFYTRIIIN